MLFKLPNRVLLLFGRIVRSDNILSLIHTAIVSNRNHKENRKISLIKHKCKLTIVFCSNSLGGITDWFKGMVSLFDFCEKNGLVFKIHAKEKFDFEHFFLPNSYDWSLSEMEYFSILTDKQTLHVWLSDSWKKYSDVWEEQQFVLRSIAESRRVSYVIIHSTSPYGLPSFGNRFIQLFKMSSMLENSVLSEKGKIDGAYYSVSFRFVNLLQDSSEVVTGIEPLSDENQQILVKRCIEELSFLISQHPNKKILVTTDSYHFLLALDKCLFPDNTVFYLKGEQIHNHIGFSNKISEAGVLKSYTEFMLISDAERCFLVKLGPMYESKFPKWAAALGNRPYSIIEEQ